MEPVKKRSAWPVVLGIAAALIALAVIGYFTLHFWNPATCTEPETCRICGKTRGEALGHDWGEWETVTEPGCTEPGEETRVCATDPKHVETREIPAPGHVWQEATCTAPAVCTVCGMENEGPLGHDWGEAEYLWAEDMGSVTAARVCRNDPAHVETETVETRHEILIPAACETPGTSRYTAAFENPAFETQETTLEDIPALGHDWGEVECLWSDDHGSVRATRVCRNDPDHVETETVITTRQSVPASCEADGTATYTAVFGNPAFGTRTEAVTLPPLGHDWGEAEFVWADDHGSVTATRVCRNDPDHVETETVAATAEISPASCEEDGTAIYTAVFGNPAFGTRTEAVTLPAPGHDWSEVEYRWANDCAGVTATRVCRSDPAHVETETVVTTARVTAAPSCEEPGTTTYAAAFKNPDFDRQEKAVQNIPARGHSWSEVEYVWADDDGSVTATRICRSDRSHVETETALTTARVSTPAGCTTPGATTYTASFRNSAFETQTKTVENIPAAGHKWVEATETSPKTCTICGATVGSPLSGGDADPISAVVSGSKLTITGTGELTSLSDLVPDWDTLSSTIETVEIGGGVTSIGNRAFYYCSALKSVTIAEGVTSIGEDAFCLCHKLTSVTIPSTVAGIGEDAFYGCDLRSVTIPDSLVELAGNPFAGNNNLSSFRLSAAHPTLKLVDGVLFSKDGRLLISCPGARSGSYSIPEGTETVGEWAFYFCDEITSLTIPSSVTAIEDNAFEQCGGLKSLTIPEGVVRIGDNAFGWCGDLERLSLPSSLKTIGGDAFIGCRSLKTAVLPEGLKTLGNGAFSRCRSLESVSIPASLTELGENPFESCESLKTIKLPSKHSTLKLIDGMLYDKKNGALLCCPASRSGSVTLPAETKLIADYAFFGCAKLTSVTIPDGVTEIGRFVFNYCDELQSVGIPKSVTKIGAYAFDDCGKLKTISFAGTKAQWAKIDIGRYAIPEGVTVSCKG